MNKKQSTESSFLDNVREQEGPEKCRQVVEEILQTGGKKALMHINHERLSFPCLYLAMPHIKPIYRRLNTRNAIALRIVTEILQEGEYSRYLTSNSKDGYLVLRWILETGGMAEIHEDDYEMVLDTVASILLHQYNDTDILPVVASMIFKRNRQGRNIHDLIWILFKVHNPVVLKLIAEYLYSENHKDRELASNLLSVGEMRNFSTDPRVLYEKYLYWLQDNDPYLYFTEQSLNFASKPTFCNIDLERKYLKKGTDSYEKQPLQNLERQEEQALEVFKTLGAEDQQVLSEHSHTFYKQSAEEWQKWLQMPVEEQIKKIRQGGSLV